MKLCDHNGGTGKCEAPAMYAGVFVVPKGVKFHRCRAHLGHLSPNEKWDGREWRKYELPRDRLDRRQLERTKRELSRIPF